MSLCLATLAVSCLKAYAGDQETIVGTVEAAGMDDAGNVTAISIWTAADEYDVSPEGEGAELLKYLNKTVKATGTVSVDEEGQVKTINVTAYEEAQPVKDEEVPDGK